jgi:outer membrane scaffolding protein for murein synthesis (MipA/OmpV family)
MNVPFVSCVLRSLTIVFLINVCVAPAAYADVRTSPIGPPIYIKATELDLGEKDDKWHGRYGVGLALVPEFAGSDGYALDIDLDLKLFWKNTFFFENGTLGLITFNNRIWRAGVMLRGVDGRRRRNLPVPLQGLGKIDVRLDGGAFVGMSLYKFYLTGEVFTDLSGVTSGQTFNLEGGYTKELSRKARLVPYVRLKWGSNAHMQSFFGVTPAQSAATGLTAFRAHAGLYESAIGAIFENDLSQHWRLGASANLGLLSGAASNSPITRSRFGSRGQYSLRVKLLKTF